MKLLLASLLFTLSAGVAFADHHEEGKNFEEAKAMALQHADKRIEANNKHKACISAAKDKDALKKCREEMKDMHEDMKEMRKDHREKMKEMRKKKKDK